MKILLISILTTALIAVTASAAPGNAAKDTPTKEIPVNDIAPLVEREWKLVDLCGDEVPANSRASLAFDAKGKVFGSGPVNRFFGEFRFVAGAIKIDKIGATKRAGAPEDMKREQAYLAALQSAKSVTIIGDDHLIITVEGEKQPLKFERVRKP